MEIAAGLITLWLVSVAVLAAYYRALLSALWREPVLRHPVLIVESDDWGPGPAHHAQRLEGLKQLLGDFEDSRGRSPVMTLGVILAIPDRPLPREGPGADARLTLDDRRFGEILTAMRAGARAGVFSLQLHGLEHYWAPALRSAAANDPRVHEWLHGEGELGTEALPAALQARWVNGSSLPSLPLPPEAIAGAVEAETRAFARVFGQPARVVVPPTFVWNADVERAWAGAGVAIIVTPGRRYVGHDAEGKLRADRVGIRNGERSPCGPIYLVRDDYFEPMLGHRAERAVNAVETKTRLGRPTLLETHRANFVGDARSSQRALEELRRLFARLLEKYPDVRFVSTEELAVAIAARDPGLVETGLRRRLHVWLGRAAAVDRVRKLAALTGLLVPGWVLHLLTRPRQPLSYGAA